MDSIYLDNSATTKPYREVVEEMTRYYYDQWGNPSSSHTIGRQARAKLDDARAIIADALGVSPTEIYFTSGGTESDNLAIKGYLNALKRADGPGRDKIVTSAIEHPAVLQTCRYLAKRDGYRLVEIRIDSNGLIDLDRLRSEIDEKTAIVTIMSSNNEIGTIQPIEECLEAAGRFQVGSHTDAVQSFLKIPFNPRAIGVGMATVSAHKIHGPKGIGALYVDRKLKLDPIAHGGSHEMKLRSGTENVAAIMGFAKAVEIGRAKMESRIARMKSLRDELEKKILATIPYAHINGLKAPRLPHISNISFECVEGEALLISLNMAGIYVSTGSACSSGSLEPSHVLLALEIPHEMAHGSIRFSFGYENTLDQVERVVAEMGRIVERVRAISPLWDNQAGRPISIESARLNATTS